MDLQLGYPVAVKKGSAPGRLVVRLEVIDADGVPVLGAAMDWIVRPEQVAGWSENPDTIANELFHVEGMLMSLGSMFAESKP